MKSRERFVLPSSEYYNFSPSALSREYLLHVLCVGDFCYAPGYDLQRNSFDSFLMEVILEGSVQIETEGEHFTARAGPGGHHGLQQAAPVFLRCRMARPVGAL